MNKLLVLGPNPAWQKTLFFERFRPGEVNRAQEMRAFASGKGVNFCRAVRCAGRASAVLLQFVGGDNGEYLVRELNREGLVHRSVTTRHPTRCCVTCLCRKTRSMTELIEPSYPVSEAEIEAFRGELLRELPGTALLALCGTLPTGTDPEFYARMAAPALAMGIPLLVDSYRHIESVLEQRGRIYLKVNLEELRCLTGEEHVKSAFRALFARYPGVAAAAITDGPRQACLAEAAGTLIRYTLPELPELVSPLGCGDTASAVLASELVAGTPLDRAFRAALAGASANCLNEVCGSFEPATAEELALRIGMTRSTW